MDFLFLVVAFLIPVVLGFLIFMLMVRYEKKTRRAQASFSNSAIILGAGILASVTAFLIRVAAMQIPFYPSNKLLSIFVISIFAKSLPALIVKLIIFMLVPFKNRTFGQFFNWIILISLPFASFDFAWWILHKDVFQAVMTCFMQGFSTILTGYFIWSLKRYAKHFMPLIYAFILQGIFYFFISFAFPFKYISIAAVLFAMVEARLWFVILNEEYEKRIDKILFNFSNSN